MCNEFGMGGRLFLISRSTCVVFLCYSCIAYVSFSYFHAQSFKGVDMLHVKIIKQVPNDQMHVKTNTTKIKIGLPPRKRFHHFEHGSCSCMDYW